MIMNAENDRYHIPPQKAAEGAGQKDETRLALALHRRLSPAAASSRSYSAAVSSLVISRTAANAANAAASRRYFFRRCAALFLPPQPGCKAVKQFRIVLVPFPPCGFFIILPGDYFTIRKCRGCFDRTAEKAAWFSKENQAAIPCHTVFSW